MAKTTKKRSARAKDDGRIMLPDGRWKRQSCDEDGKPIPLEQLATWENGPHGYPISWWSQKDTAEAFGITTRWLQDLEDKGMPSRGRRGTKEYCWPDVLNWYIAYKRREKRRERVRFLSMDVARAEHQLWKAEEAAQLDGR